MYENMTYEVILQNMLDRVPSTFDKREGSIIFDALAPAAAELAQVYIELDTVLNETFADTASGEYLEKRCAERGVQRGEATCAVVQAKFTPSTIDVTGYRFRSGEHYYKATEGENGTYLMTCETAGSEPNGIVGQLIPVDYISGLEAATITQVLIPGEDKESDEELRERYFDAVNSQAFGGNISDYKAKTKAIAGVGGVKVTPAWSGGGTVALTIVDSDYSVPSSALIEKVQGTMDEIAPIGHVVTVFGAEEVEIDITTSITYQDGWNWESAGAAIVAAVDEYFRSLAKEWDDTNTLIVRVSGVEQRILSCQGVIDVQNTKLGGKTGNWQLTENEIPVRGVITDGS